ncbi:hypothetical protein [Tistrella mobilis]|uniref:hypothetical protein n=1 Tax=Tistrella mobilis TaxID=171437 RepID=UPI001E5D947E|nr:hypothetical protein [Tistrella mobilis]
MTGPDVQQLGQMENEARLGAGGRQGDTVLVDVTERAVVIGALWKAGITRGACRPLRLIRRAVARQKEVARMAPERLDQGRARRCRPSAHRHIALYSVQQPVLQGVKPKILWHRHPLRSQGILESWTGFRPRSRDDVVIRSA